MKKAHLFWLIFSMVFVMPCISLSSAMNGGGSLSVHSVNTRYFADGRGETVYLTGSHTWNNFQDISAEVDSFFDYDAFLDFMQENNHNFMRLWVWEQASWLSTVERKVSFQPLPYQRTGPGLAIDEGLKFDLTLFNQEYFDRLRQRVQTAERRGIYVAVMLFQGFSIEPKPSDSTPTTPVAPLLAKILYRMGLESLVDRENNPWRGHPFNVKNNSNGIDGDPRRRLNGHDVHTLALPEITVLQEQYVRKVIDTLSDLDNVLWEIANESHSDSTAWQYHMIDYIRSYEKSRGVQHPILMTVQWPDGTNSSLFESRAEAVSPNPDGGFRDTSVAADGQKVIITDTDHLWGIGGDWKWVWKSFLMGMNPIFMDPYTIPDFQAHPTKPEWELVRKNMGYTRTFAERLDMAAMTPRPELASSGHCLAREGKEYLVYVPAESTVKVELFPENGVFGLEWFDPLTGATVAGEEIKVEDDRYFQTPFAHDGILYLFKRTKP